MALISPQLLPSYWPSFDWRLHSISQAVNTCSNVLCPQASRPPGLNWSPTINNHFLITQSPMRIPLFTDQHLRLLDLRSRSQQLESQFIVWSGRAENLNPTLEQELNSYTDATFALGRLTQLTCIHVDIIQRHVIWLRWRLLNLGFEDKVVKYISPSFYSINAAQWKSKHNWNQCNGLEGRNTRRWHGYFALGGTLDSPLKRGGQLNLAAQLRTLRSPHWSRLAEQRIHRMAKRLRGPTSNGLGEPQITNCF